jgi:hypothetical protein
MEGRPVTSSEFFALLREDAEFCAQLGRAMLAAGRLETALKRFLHRQRPTLKTDNANLGFLIRQLEKHSLLPKMRQSLELLNKQRNYLAHSIHALLSEWIDETILERSELLDSDLVTYEERAWQLTENLNGLAEIIERENDR